MRNLSLMFSVISSVVFILTVFLFFITDDKNVLSLFVIAVISLMITSGFMTASTLETDEQRVRREYDANDQIKELWTRLSEVERNLYDNIEETNRSFDSRVSSIWDDIGRLNDKCSDSKKR
jgi:uncharacterized membrane protein